MKEREEITRKIDKKRRGRSSRRKPSSLSKSTSVPLDIISEILSKLPLKSLMRFRCVSKQWSSVITEPSFKKSFQTLSSTRPSLLIVGFRESDGFFVLSIPQQNWNESNDSNPCSQPIESYRMTHANHGCSFTIATESVQGLMICFQEPTEPIVWNPSLRKLLPLSKPGDTWKGIKAFLGYDPIEGKHKVVCMPKLGYGEALDECKVLTLGSGSAQEAWRKVETIPNHFPLTGDNNGYYHARCINGVVYYYANLGPGRVIMSFDVRSEKFNVIPSPPREDGFGMYRMTLSSHGKLACVGYNYYRKTILMIVLEDATKHEWSKHQFSSLPGDCSNLNHFDVMGDSDDDGKLIYVKDSCLEIIYIDPKRKTFRRVKYRDVLDDFRQRNGLEDRHMNLDGFHFFPNHIETLVSL